jgi:hypothetical protein
MQYAKKFMLVPYVKPMLDPEEQKIIELDSSMTSILNDKKLKLSQKLDNYNHVLAKFMAVYGHNTFVPTVHSNTKSNEESDTSIKVEPHESKLDNSKLDTTPVIQKLETPDTDPYNVSMQDYKPNVKTEIPPLDSNLSPIPYSKEGLRGTISDELSQSLNNLHVTSPSKSPKRKLDFSKIKANPQAVNEKVVPTPSKSPKQKINISQKLTPIKEDENESIVNPIPEQNTYAPIHSRKQVRFSAPIEHVPKWEPYNESFNSKTPQLKKTKKIKKTKDNNEATVSAVHEPPPFPNQYFQETDPHFKKLVAKIKTKHRNATIKSSAKKVHESIRLKEKYRPTEPNARTGLNWEHLNSFYGKIDKHVTKRRR